MGIVFYFYIYRVVDYSKNLENRVSKPLRYLRVDFSDTGVRSCVLEMAETAQEVFEFRDKNSYECFWQGHQAVATSYRRHSRSLRHSRDPRQIFQDDANGNRVDQNL